MIQQLFPDYYYLYDIKNHDTLKSYFLPIAKEKCEPQPIWKCKILTSRSKNSDIDYTPFFKELHEATIKMVDEFGATKELKYNIESVWINLYNEGCSQEIHHHSSPNCNLSFVYFVNYDETNDAKFYFVNEKSNNYSASGLNRILLPYRKTHWPDIFSPKFKEGQLMIFPSHLPHGVELQTNNSDRCTISGNIFLYPEKWSF